eukprot:CAMPEP_0173168854 /NCGR_PEP_ID=MMETSP1141-20130122/379_1 /TAXON_ID=483371 /ORGANISM="non described non described, Strain CCMP2298" /LENGTH=77 /DNA_ID=CAMNT_0014090615 /DNA_START=321 /DNA_END=554 /DNA_ORIENTATION=-
MAVQMRYKNMQSSLRNKNMQNPSLEQGGAIFSHDLEGQGGHDSHVVGLGVNHHVGVGVAGLGGIECHFGFIFGHICV